MGNCLHLEERRYSVYKHTTPSGKVYIGIDGEYITTYLCMEDAAEATKTHSSNIRKVIKGERKQAGGFKRQYEEAYNNV